LTEHICNGQSAAPFTRPSVMSHAKTFNKFLNILLAPAVPKPSPYCRFLSFSHSPITGFCFPMPIPQNAAPKPNSDPGHLMFQVSSSHNTHPVGLLWTINQFVPLGATYTTHNKQKRQTFLTSAGFESAEHRKRAAADLWSGPVHTAFIRAIDSSTLEVEQQFPPHLCYARTKPRDVTSQNTAVY
jgi:hypothetical protein